MLHVIISAGTFLYAKLWPEVKLSILFILMNTLGLFFCPCHLNVYETQIYLIYLNLHLGFFRPPKITCGTMSHSLKRH